MTRRVLVIPLAAIAIATLPVTAGAQEEPQDERSLVGAIAEGVITAFQRPVRPVVTVVAPGGGLGVGVRYEPRGLWGGRGVTALEGVTAKHGYWSALATLGLRGDAYRLQTYVRGRDMTRLDLYGLGTHTSRADRTVFRLRDREAGLIGTLELGAITLGGRAASLWPELAAGESPDLPSFEQRFTEAVLPGMAMRSRFAHYETFLDVRQGGVRRRTQGRYRVSYGHFHDARSRRYSFDRLRAELQQRLPGLARGQRLTLHGLVSTTHTGVGHAVPFYFQDTLGGAQAVRQFEDGVLGTDGSTATLRGFDDLRFRGPHALLLQAEYRWALWGPVEMTAFVDAGKVTMRRRDLDLNDLRRDYGVSVGMMAGPASVVRVDAGFGGGEGPHVFVSYGIGSLFP